MSEGDAARMKAVALIPQLEAECSGMSMLALDQLSRANQRQLFQRRQQLEASLEWLRRTAASEGAQAVVRLQEAMRLLQLAGYDRGAAEVT
jgi:hypothetical protein